MARIKGIGGLLGSMTVVFAASAAACGDGLTSPGSPAPQTYVLSGVVIDATPDGPVPMEGAVVRHLEGRGSATTDSSGSYSIPGVPAGRVTVMATKDGYTVATRSVALTADARVDLELARLPPPPPPPAPFVLSGLVFERTAGGQAPVEGVRVEDSYRHVVSTTDANGRYSISLTPTELGRSDGFVALYVTREGFQTYTRELAMWGDTRVDIELVRR